MPSMKEAGMSNGGEWLKAADLAAEKRVFEIVNAYSRTSDFKKDDGTPVVQIVYEIVFVGSVNHELEEAYLFKFNLELNKARQFAVDWFEENQEPLNGVNEENGLVLFKGKGGKGNPPFLFRDAAPEEIESELARQAEAADDSVPF